MRAGEKNQISYSVRYGLVAVQNYAHCVEWESPVTSALRDTHESHHQNKKKHIILPATLTMVSGVDDDQVIYLMWPKTTKIIYSNNCLVIKVVIKKFSSYQERAGQLHHPESSWTYRFGGISFSLLPEPRPHFNSVSHDDITCTARGCQEICQLTAGRLREVEGNNYYGPDHGKLRGSNNYKLRDRGRMVGSNNYKLRDGGRRCGSNNYKLRDLGRYTVQWWGNEYLWHFK